MSIIFGKSQYLVSCVNERRSSSTSIRTGLYLIIDHRRSHHISTLRNIVIVHFVQINNGEVWVFVSLHRIGILAVYNIWVIWVSSRHFIRRSEAPVETKGNNSQYNTHCEQQLPETHFFISEFQVV